MIIDKNLAKRIEHCIQMSHINVTQQYIATNTHAAILEIGGGAACFSGHDSFLSQVIGWGFNSDISNPEDDLNQIEQFYLQKQHQQVDIELCPFVDDGIINLLSTRGYHVTEVNQISVLDLNTYENHFSKEHIAIADDVKAFAQCVSEGFSCSHLKHHFEYYALSGAIYPFAAYVDHKMVAGATCAIDQDICDLGVTSTLPAFRGRGFQKELLHARLSFAIKKGVKLATVTTEPGSISDINTQKLGFRCAYTRLKLTKNF